MYPKLILDIECWRFTVFQNFWHLGNLGLSRGIVKKLWLEIYIYIAIYSLGILVDWWGSVCLFFSLQPFHNRIWKIGTQPKDSYLEFNLVFKKVHVTINYTKIKKNYEYYSDKIVI